MGCAIWSPVNRRQHRPFRFVYEANLINPECAAIGPLTPKPVPGARSLIWTMQALLNADFYVPRGGIARRLISKDLPPRSINEAERFYPS